MISAAKIKLQIWQQCIFFGLILSLSVLLTSQSFASKANTPPRVADQVDLSRYMGGWYEIAAFPNIFQRGCRCSRAFYSLQGTGVHIVNQCLNKNNQLKQATARAWQAKDGSSSQLKVQFFWPFRGDYWILYVSPNYQDAIVGSPHRKYLWFLSRSRQLSEKRYQYLVSLAAAQGFDVSKLRRTSQHCDS